MQDNLFGITYEVGLDDSAEGVFVGPTAQIPVTAHSVSALTLIAYQIVTELADVADDVGSDIDAFRDARDALQNCLQPAIKKLIDDDVPMVNGCVLLN